MENSDVDWEKKRAIKVPEYDWKNGSPDEFYETFVKRPHPVVLRGFMKNEALLKDYSFDAILEKYGEEDVMLTKREIDGYPGKLKEVNNPAIYLHNSEVLFNKYPEIWDRMKTGKAEPYLKLKCGYAQLFVGRKGTGTPLHAASNTNFFYQVDGTKRWYFIDPYDNYLASPYMGLGLAARSYIGLYPDDYDESVMPAFKYCPYFYTDLEPGDVVFNPTWWGHAIRNTSEKTVGIAARWLTDGIVGAKWTSPEENYDIDRIASMIFFAGPQSWQFLHGVLADASPKYDEHMTLREVKNRFTHTAIAVAKGEVNIDGWRPIC